MEELDITKIFYLNKPTRIRSREWGGGGGAINVQSCYKRGIPMDYFLKETNGNCEAEKYNTEM